MTIINQTYCKINRFSFHFDDPIETCKTHYQRKLAYNRPESNFAFIGYCERCSLTNNLSKWDNVVIVHFANQMIASSVTSKHSFSAHCIAFTYTHSVFCWKPKKLSPIYDTPSFSLIYNSKFAKLFHKKNQAQMMGWHGWDSY